MTNWNESGLEFVDISCEEYREYTFSGGDCIHICKPTHLHVSASGSHRIATEDGQGFYIPADFICINWAAREGQPIFVK